MMDASVETGLSRAALRLSGVFELVMLPRLAWQFYALRDKGQRLTRRRLVELEQGLVYLRGVVSTAQRMESQLESMDLSLETSRLLVLEAQRVAILNLRQQVQDGLLPQTSAAKVEEEANRKEKAEFHRSGTAYQSDVSDSYAKSDFRAGDTAARKHPANVQCSGIRSSSLSHTYHNGMSHNTGNHRLKLNARNDRLGDGKDKLPP